MYKAILTLFIFLFFSKITKGKDNEKDSLRTLTTSIKEDSFYVKNAINLGVIYQNSELDSSLYFAHNALIVSRKIKYPKGEAYSLNLLGIVQVRLGNYSQALQRFLEALKICEKANLPIATASVETNLGDLYYKQGEIRKALEYTLKAKEISEAIGDKRTISSSYINIGNYYEILNQFDSARINTQLGFEVAQKIQDESYMGVCMNNLGNIYAKTKQNGLAIEHYRSSLPYYFDTEDYEGLCESYLGLAKVFKATGNTDSCIYYAMKSYNTAVAQKFAKYIYDASLFITQHYQEAKNIDSAYVYQQAMLAAKETLFSEEKVRQVQSLTIGETLRQQELADEKLKEAEERKHNLQYIGIAVFIFLFALFIIIGSQRHIKLSTINFMVTVALLLTFEFISLFIHPYIFVWTHHSPIYMLLILVTLASILVPLHHRLEHWIKDRLAHRIIHPKTKKLTPKRVE